MAFKDTNGKNVPPKRVLMFNPHKRFVGVVCSVTAAAKLMNTSTSNIFFALNGETLTACGLYWRYLYPEINCTLNDLFNMSLKEYDKLCGLERRYFHNSTLSRKGMKYEMNPTKQKERATKRKANEQKAKEIRAINAVFGSIRM